MTTLNSNYAGFWMRLAAYLLDAIIIFVVFFILGLIVGVIGGEGILDSSGFELTSNIISFICGWLYFSLMESSRHQGTLGKMALGIKVTDMNRTRISFSRATGRYFGKILSFIILFVGFIMIAFTEKKQGLHDILAKTLVIKK